MEDVILKISVAIASQYEILRNNFYKRGTRPVFEKRIKHCWEKLKTTESRIVQTILKKNQVGRLLLSDFKIYYKARVINTMLYWWKDRHIDWRKRIESPEVEPHLCGQLVFDKGAKAFNGKEKVFTTNGVRTIGYTNGKKLNLNLYLTEYIKINSKCHVDLNSKS